MKPLIITLVALTAIQGALFSASASASTCREMDRTIYYSGKAEPIYAAPGKWPEIKFPKKIAAVLPESPEGLQIRDVPFADRLFLTVETPDYYGKVLVHTENGDSYHLTIVGQETCRDLTVTVRREAEKSTYIGENGETRARQRGLKLIDYMYLGKIPKGFRREVAPGPKKERLVFRQGPVHFYLKEIWRKGSRTGTTLIVENKGRTPYQIALESIDYGSPEIREHFGIVSEVSMMPSSRRLGPAPEFAADQANPTHRGLLFIASEVDK